MTAPKPTTLAFGLAGLGMVGGIVLAGTGHVIPPELWSATFASLGAGAGISVPTVATVGPSAPT